MKISKILCIFLFGANIYASGIPVVDVAAIANQIKDYLTQIQQYEQMYQQLQQQINMVKMAQTNLKQLSKQDWDNLDQILYQTNNLMSSIGAISYNVNNLTSQFNDTYKNAEELRNQYINSNNEENFTNNYDRNKKINTNLQNISKATLQKLQMDHQRLKQETQMIQKLKERSENSVGQLQATQATNDLIAYQIDELRKLRVAMMDQMNMLANVIAAQSNKEQAMEEKRNIFFTSNPDVPYGKKKWDSSVLKW